MLASFYPSSNSPLTDPWELQVFWPLPVSNPAFAGRLSTARRCVVESGLHKAPITVHSSRGGEARRESSASSEAATTWWLQPKEP